MITGANTAIINDNAASIIDIPPGDISVQFYYSSYTMDQVFLLLDHLSEAVSWHQESI